MASPEGVARDGDVKDIKMALVSESFVVLLMPNGMGMAVIMRMIL